MKNDFFKDGIDFGGDNSDTLGASRICFRVCNGTSATELTGDISLPDYLPEIRRLLRVNVTPSAPAKFVSAGSAQFSGGVEYSVCYVGADGGIYGASFPDEYSFTVKFDPDVEYDMNEGMNAIADIAVESAVARVTSARKINIKARLCANATVVGGARVYTPSWTTESVHSRTQKLTKETVYCNESVGSNDEIELKDRIEVGSSDVRIVSKDCAVFLDEVKSGDGYVDCHGSIRMRYLLCNDGERTPYSVEKKLDFDEIVEMDGIRTGNPCSAYCVCTGISSDINGESGELECSVRLRLVARGYSPKKMSYVADAYSPEYDTNCSLSEIVLPIVTDCGTRNMTFISTVPAEKLLSGRDGNGLKIIDVTASAMSNGIERAENGYGVVGSVGFNVIYSVETHEGETEIASADIELPFRLECGTVNAASEHDNCTAFAVDSTVRVKGDELELGCEIFAAYSSVSSTSIMPVEDAVLSEKIGSDRSGISVHYPSSEDSLWSVAKKYGVPLDAVVDENGISSDIPADSSESLRNLKFLIV